jgi:GT2 family glycosyltransferase
MDINVVMVGMDGWEEFTLPAILSIQEHTDANIILVDHGKHPYPDTKGVERIRLDSPVSYAKALNIGINHSKADWYFITNNDVVCKEDFTDETYDEGVIYASKIHERSGERWFDNCFVLLSHEVWEEVGEFDENFLIAAYEDADYSFRAVESGYKVEEYPFPFRHWQGKTRFGIHGFQEIRDDNYFYLQRKYPEKEL